MRQWRPFSLYSQALYIPAVKCVDYRLYVYKCAVHRAAVRRGWMCRRCRGVAAGWSGPQGPGEGAVRGLCSAPVTGPGVTEVMPCASQVEQS